jgi:hypothetical protein
MNEFVSNEQNSISRDQETITISKREYEELLKKVHFLECLEACGVDNWEGYDEAWELYENDEDFIDVGVIKL